MSEAFGSEPREIDPNIAVTSLVWPESSHEEGHDIWLGEKGDGPGKGKRLPPGGRCELADQSRAAAAVREADEEWAIHFVERLMRFRALCWFDHIDDPRRSRLAFYFIGPFTGIPTASAELLDPRRYKKDALPIAAMWPADLLWVPPLFAGILPLPVYYQHFIYRGGVVIEQRPLDSKYRDFLGVPVFTP